MSRHPLHVQTFRFPSDPESELADAIDPSLKDGVISVDAHSVRVSLGEPPVFEVTIPRERIRSVERAADLAGRTRGVHGGRGRWLVNRSGRDLVTIHVEPEVEASLALSRVRLKDDPEIQRRRFARTLLGIILRDRTVKVRELTVSVVDPDRFVDAAGR